MKRILGALATALLLVAGVVVVADTDVSAQTGGESRYRFDQVVKHNFDSTQNALFRTVGDGSLGLFQRPGQGLAMRFPAAENPPNDGAQFDGGYLEVPDQGDFYDPGTRNMSITVSLRMGADLADHAMNLVQKGFFTDAQWKLQIDEGVLGCRFAEAGGAGAPEAFATYDAVANAANVADLFDDAWHNVTCRRVGNAVELLVGQTVVDTATTAAVLDVASSASVSIGGVLRTNPAPRVNDQFHGDMDNLRISFD